MKTIYEKTTPCPKKIKEVYTFPRHFTMWLFWDEFSMIPSKRFLFE